MCKINETTAKLEHVSELNQGPVKTIIAVHSHLCCVSAPPYVFPMPDNPLLQWTLDAKKALQQAEQLSSHASILVRDSSASLDQTESLVPKCEFLNEALKGQIELLEKLAGGCYAVEDHARREFEVRVRMLTVTDCRSLSRSWTLWISS